MTNEQEFILECLSDHLNGKRTIFVSNSIDENLLIQCSNAHQVEGIIFYQCRACKEFEKLQPAYAMSVYYSSSRFFLIKKLKLLFEENHVRFILFKGIDIARLYPIPSLRSMGDIDILVDKCNMVLVEKLLLAEGFKLNKIESYDGTWHFSNNNIEIEIHQHILHQDSINSKLQDFFESCWEYCTEDGYLEPEYHMVYLLAHIREHLIERGIGLRQFMDISVLSKQKLNWNRIEEYLNKLQLKQFAQHCFSLCEKWFGISFDMSESISKEFYDNATKQILNDGVFGFGNSKKDVWYLGRKIKAKGKINTFFRTIFPSYIDLYTDKKYVFLKGKPYLLPAVWIYRIFLKIKKDSVKSGLYIAFSPYTKKAEFAEREAYLKQWGL